MGQKGGGWRKRFNYTRESDLLMEKESPDMLMAREYARLSETEAATLLEEKEQDLVLAAELGKTPTFETSILMVRPGWFSPVPYHPWKRALTPIRCNNKFCNVSIYEDVT